MGRSLRGRIHQYERRLPSTVRKRRAEESPVSYSARLASLRRHKQQSTEGKKRQSLEAIASDARVERVQQTTARNSINQGRSISSSVVGEDEDAFFREIDAPLSTVCGVCGELVPPHTARSIPYSPLDTRFQLLQVTVDGHSDRGLIAAGVTSNGETELVAFCRRCDAALQGGFVPRYSIASGFKLSEVPKCLTVLNPMEARMIGLGVCFTTCYTLGNLGQSASRGNSINFWNDQIDLVAKLPRPPEQCGVIQLRAATSGGSNTYYNIRPWLLREAITWLRLNNPLYRDVVVDESVMATLKRVPDLPSIEFDEAEIEEGVIQRCDEDEEELALTESFVLEHGTETEREDDLILAALQGTKHDCAQPTLRQHDRLMNEYTTRLLMQCCFPTLFPDAKGGLHPLPDEGPRRHSYTLADFCEHLMAWHDRRFVIHPTFKFYCLNLIQRRQVDGLLAQVHPTEESGAPGPQDNSIEHPHDGNDVQKYLNNLKPYFRSVRGSGLYWSNVRQDVMAMIGNPALETPWPTFFITLSAADTIWPDFFRVCDPSLSMEAAATLSAAKKRQFLNENPDLAARHFHRRFQAFFRHILCGRSKPLGEIVHFFWRIEFQHRGSPHVHALLWIKDSPNILELSQSESGKEQLRCFADRFISCLQRFDPSRNQEAPDPVCTRPPPVSARADRERDLGALVRRVQQHVCSSRSACQRDGACRFGFPKALLQRTEVTRNETPGAIKVEFEHARDNDATNNYNPTMLSTWRANMDIKVIGNAYGAAEYTAAYISKAEPDTIRFRKTIETALAKLPHDASLQQRLRRTATTLLAIREISSQEAIYILSAGLNLYGKSRNVLRVKVSRHDRRFYRLSHDDEQKVSSHQSLRTAARIEPIERAYMERPSTPLFNDLNFQQFCESYEISDRKADPRQRLARWQLLSGVGFIKERQKKQVVCPSPKYRADELDPNFCYAQLFLLKPWRSLSELPLTDTAICAAYNTWKTTNSVWTRSVQEQIERRSNMTSSKSSSITLPATNWSIEGVDDLQILQPSLACTHAAPSSLSQHEYSPEEVARARQFLHDVVRPFLHDGSLHAQDSNRRTPFMYPTDGQQKQMTEDQWKPFALWMFQTRARKASTVTGNQCAPMHMIVSGEGGTGKSWLINQIVADVEVVFGRTEARKRTLLMAHQGSAAFLIGGRTLSSALGLPSHAGSNFRRPYVPLASTVPGSSTLRRLQNEFEHVQMIIIDEFGVISCGMLHWIDHRLREIFPDHQHEPFGGRDVLFTGDPAQLGPIKPSPLSTPTSQLFISAERKGRELWQSIDLYFILRQQNRGVNDPAWYSAIRHVRDGNCTMEDVNFINCRTDETSFSRTPRTIYLAYTNKDVDAANDDAVYQLGSSVVEIHAHHSVHPKEHGNQSQSITLETAHSLLQEAEAITTASTKFLPKVLKLCIGAPIVLTFNVEQRAGLCNGSKGEVFDIIADDGTEAHHPIVLARMFDYNGPSFYPNVSKIVPITSRTVALNPNSSAGFRLSRTALPIRLGFATTIHKIQGQTCETVILNPARLRGSALAYVALSRVRERNHILLSTPLTLHQLQKPDRLRVLDDAEDTRIKVLDAQSIARATPIVERMKYIASLHNSFQTLHSL